MSANGYEPLHAAADDARAQIRELLNRTLAVLDADGAEPVDCAAPRNEEGSAQAEPNESRTGRLSRIFGLTPFELDVLLLCVAVELDPESCDVLAIAQNDNRLRYPTFQLALRQLPDAHWSAIVPRGALRRWRLIEISPGELLMTAQLRIAEPVFHFLMGASALDERLEAILEPIDPSLVMPSCYRVKAEQLALLTAQATEHAIVPHLDGNATHAKRSVAAVACAAMGLRLYGLSAANIPAAQSERTELQRLLERDAALSGFALLVDIENAMPAERAAAAQLVDGLASVVMICGNGVLNLRRNTVERVTLDRPGPADQRALWAFALGEDAALCNGHVERVATQFPMDSESILRAGAAVRRRLRGQDENSSAGEMLIEFCRADARVSLDALAQKIEAKATWADLVLPENSLEMLRAIAAQVRQQGKVLDRWGFAAQTSRGLGISALFHGLSGTGKTLAAEVLAHDLRLDLYRIDLSQMVSKYIGETEKNLRVIFDAAENTGSVLLFDEADALFGKRSEVRDSHDRYANIEVSYLLQRIEAYRGLAILTTNIRGALDTAFLRRISFFVNFPFPDQPLRRCIWERMFPLAMPAQNLDFNKLARLNLPGGNIRNIALNAAYIAADLNQPVRMEHLLTAARRECAKAERPLTAAETGGWV